MIKSLKPVALVLWAAATATIMPAAAQTIVLQTIDLNFTIYQQGASNNTKVSDQVTNFTSKSLINALGIVVGTNFGSGAKLVQSTVFSNVTVATSPIGGATLFSTNLAMPATNSFLLIGATQQIGPITDTLTISGNQLMDSDGDQITISSDVITAGGSTNESVTINTNAGYLTTLTPSTDTNGVLTNVNVLLQTEAAPATTETILTDISSSIDILYGGSANELYPVSAYLNIGTNSQEVLVETGSGLDTTNVLATNLTAQTSYSIQSMGISYFTSNSPNNLTLGLQGFVKQTLKVDNLGGHGTNKMVVDIFGANATWNVNGYGYMGGVYTTNSSNTIPVMGGYLINPNPVVVEGSVNVSFLKNLKQ